MFVVNMNQIAKNDDVDGWCAKGGMVSCKICAALKGQIGKRKARQAVIGWKDKKRKLSVTLLKSNSIYEKTQTNRTETGIVVQ